MIFNELFNECTPTEVKKIAAQLAKNNSLIWNNSTGTILDASYAHLEFSPKIEADDSNSLIEKWLRKYNTGYNNRISQRKSNVPRTIYDDAINSIILGRLPKLTPDQLKQIMYAHRLAMSAENILGLLLEEFLSVHLVKHGWHFCWGDTLRSVDFVRGNGKGQYEFLQIKNRSNSENSSSSSVRNGTTIMKWFRVDANTGNTKWNDLNNICKSNNQPLQLDESLFIDFATKTISNNIAALAVESGNPWS